MNCQDIQKFAFTYLDCEFDGRERGEFETHLRLCCSCKAAVERDAMFRDIVRNHLDVPPPADHVRQRMRAHIACAHSRRVSRTVFIPVALVAGATIALVGWRYLPESEARSGGSADADAESVEATAIAGIPLSPQQHVEARLEVKTAEVKTAVDDAAHLALLRQEALHSPVLVQARAQPGFQLAVNTNVLPAALVEPAEVLRGGLAPSAMAQHSPFGAVRSDESLRAMVRVHTAQLPPEVQGPATRVQKYLAVRVPGIGPLPVSVGAGVELRGARLGMIGAQPVVVYTYLAWGVPLTVLSRAAVNNHGGDDPEVESEGPQAHPQFGILLDRRAGLSLMHVVSNDRVLTLVSELGPHALLQLAP